MEAFDFSLSGAILCYMVTELKIFHSDETSALFTDKKKRRLKMPIYVGLFEIFL